MIVEVEPLPPTVRPGFATALDIHVRAAAGEVVEAATCVATLRWPGGAHRWRFRGGAPAGGHVRVATIQFEVPADAGAGDVVLDVTVGDAAARTTARLVTA